MTIREQIVKRLGRPEFDLESSREARDDGMLQVEGNSESFKAAFRRVVLSLPSGWMGTCEDLRRGWDGPKPSHPNAWGACWASAKRDGILIELTEQVQMTAIKSHARKTHLHQKV